jgi:hypothetical protein
MSDTESVATQPLHTVPDIAFTDNGTQIVGDGNDVADLTQLVEFGNSENPENNIKKDNIYYQYANIIIQKILKQKGYNSVENITDEDINLHLKSIRDLEASFETMFNEKLDFDILNDMILSNITILSKRHGGKSKKHGTKSYKKHKSYKNINHTKTYKYPKKHKTYKKTYKKHKSYKKHKTYQKIQISKKHKSYKKHTKSKNTHNPKYKTYKIIQNLLKLR